MVLPAAEGGLCVVAATYEVCGRESYPCARTALPDNISRDCPGKRAMIAASSTPSQPKCAVWPMRKDATELIIYQRLDKTPLGTMGSAGAAAEPIVADEGKRIAERHG